MPCGELPHEEDPGDCCDQADYGANNRDALIGVEKVLGDRLGAGVAEAAREAACRQEERKQWPDTECQPPHPKRRVVGLAVGMGGYGA